MRLFLGQRNCDRPAEAPGSYPSSGTPHCFPLALHDVQGMVVGTTGIAPVNAGIRGKGAQMV
jgi:hypothetical protein